MVKGLFLARNVMAREEKEAGFSLHHMNVLTVQGPDRNHALHVEGKVTSEWQYVRDLRAFMVGAL